MSQKKVVLITGANSGFGRLTAESLARRGYTVFATMRDIDGRNAGAAEALRALATGEKLDLNLVELDLHDEVSVRRAVRDVVSRAGRLDVVVNNAGAVQAGVTEAFSVDEARALFETNFFGAYAVAREALPQLRAQREGLIVNVSTGISRTPMPFMGFYSASKAALETLFEQLRTELAPFKVDSVIVQPGAYPTPILSKVLGAKDTDRTLAYGPVAEVPGKIGEGLSRAISSPDAGDPQEVADAIVRLIESPAGQRPLRTLVGKDVQGLAPLNEASDHASKAILDGFGVTALMDEARGAVTV